MCLKIAQLADLPELPILMVKNEWRLEMLDEITILDVDRDLTISVC